MAGEYHLALYRFEESGDGDVSEATGPVYWGEEHEDLSHTQFRAAAMSACDWIRPARGLRWARIDLFQVGEVGGGIILKEFNRDKDYDYTARHGGDDNADWEAYD